MAKQQSVSKLRNKLGLNQKDFWGRLHLTQSCGSRYENSARRMPKIVAAMIDIVHRDPATAAATVRKLRSARA